VTDRAVISNWSCHRPWGIMLRRGIAARHAHRVGRAGGPGDMRKAGAASVPVPHGAYAWE